MLRRNLVAAGLFAGLVTVLSACGSQTNDAGNSTVDSQAASQPRATEQPPSGTQTPQASEPAGTESAPADKGNKCTAADLKGTVRPLDTAAGNRYAELVVTNTSSATCTMYGYGGLEFVGKSGKATPTDLTRQPNPGPSVVTLRPGGTAAKRLHWGDVPSGNESDTGPCEPESTGARVIPPDDTKSFSVSFYFGSVCAKGHVEGSAYYRG